MGEEETSALLSAPSMGRQTPETGEFTTVESGTAARSELGALAWPAGLLGFALITAAVADRTGIAAFALGEPRTLPTMLAAGLMALAAGLVWAFDCSGPTTLRHRCCCCR